MQSCKYNPPAPLSALVECLWYWEGAPGTHAKERLLPNGELAIIFNLRNDPIRIYDADDLSRYETCGYAVLSGARSSCFVIDTSQQERVVGIQFRPGGAFPFFHMPASDAEGASIALEDLWGRRTGEIREQLLASRSIDSMLLTLERCLLKQLVRPVEPHPAVAFAVNRFQNPPHPGRVADVMDRIGLSSRRFIELFRREVGLTPKVFCRVRRFQRALRTIHRSTRVDWVRLALDCGYYDQAHFIHDFRSFSGFTPGGYLATATPHLNHVPLL